MSRIIRFKVKDLMKVIVVLGLVTLLIYSFLPTTMIKLASYQSQKGNHAVAIAYYDRIIRFFPNHGETPRALEYAAQHIGSNQFVMVTPASIGGAGTSFSRPRGSLSSKELAYYQQLADRFPQTPQGERAIRYLTIEQLTKSINENKIKEAIRIYEDFFHKERLIGGNYDVYEVALFMINHLYSKGYHQEAIDLALEYLEKYPEGNIYSFYLLLGDLYHQLGDLDRARENYLLAVKELQENLENLQQFESDPNIIKGSQAWTEEKWELVQNKISALEQGLKETGRVTGTITKFGKPLVGVDIMLQPQMQEGIYPLGDEYTLWQTSDSNGDFTFENLPSGSYGLGFVIEISELEGVTLQGGRFPQSRLEVKSGEEVSWDFKLVEIIQVESPKNNEAINGEEIHFIWDPVEGAAYYTLELGTYFEGGYSSSSFMEQYDGPEAILRVSSLLQKEGSYSFDDHGVVPISLFGYDQLDGKYFWGVVAHNQEGEILTTSIGFLKEQNSDFQFPKRALRKADEYLLNREYQKAIEAYEGDLIQNPQDQYALRMLIRIYRVRQMDSFPYGNTQKAEQYLQRLEQLIQ